jgi:hypothetical protein
VPENLLARIASGKYAKKGSGIEELRNPSPFPSTPGGKGKGEGTNVRPNS